MRTQHTGRHWPFHASGYFCVLPSGQVSPATRQLLNFIVIFYCASRRSRSSSVTLVSVGFGLGLRLSGDLSVCATRTCQTQRAAWDEPKGTRQARVGARPTKKAESEFSVPPALQRVVVVGKRPRAQASGMKSPVRVISRQCCNISRSRIVRPRFAQ